MKYLYKDSNINEIRELLECYIKSLSSPIDSFLEDHIIASKFYKIEIDNKLIGYFAMYENKLLTQFYVIDKYLKYGQDLLREIKYEYDIKKVFVPTCDEALLSLIIDDYTNLEKQAYFFEDCKEIDVKNKVYENGEFRLATYKDINDIRKVSADFFDNIEDHIKNSQLFVFKDKNILLGIGIIEKGRLNKEYTSIGMFTNENYRRLGIGRSILINLKKHCYKNNTKPIAGCWYYNTNSKKTLESAGMITKTRLLNITLK